MYLAEFANPEAFDFADALLKEFKGTNFPPGYRSGYTNAVYEVLSWINLGDMRIPQHSRFSKYVPMLGTKSNSSLELKLTYDIYSEHAEARAISPERIPGIVPKNATIRDYRSAQSNSEPVIYVSASGKIRSAREVTELRRTRPQRPLFVIYLLFALAALFPLSLVRLLKTGKTQHHQGQNRATK